MITTLNAAQSWATIALAAGLASAVAVAVRELGRRSGGSAPTFDGTDDLNRVDRIARDHRADPELWQRDRS